MIGKTHRIWGAHHGLVVGSAVGSLWSPYTGLSTGIAWAGLGYACATLPDALERFPGVKVKHRGPTHWPEPPLIVGMLAIGLLPWLAWLLLGGVACAMLSHWSGDLMFGKAHVLRNEAGEYVATIRPRGVPYLFGHRYIGWGIKVDSKAEKYFRVFLTTTFPVMFFVVLFFVLRR